MKYLPRDAESPFFPDFTMEACLFKTGWNSIYCLQGFGQEYLLIVRSSEFQRKNNIWFCPGGTLHDLAGSAPTDFISTTECHQRCLSTPDCVGIKVDLSLKKCILSQYNEDGCAGKAYTKVEEKYKLLNYFLPKPISKLDYCFSLYYKDWQLREWLEKADQEQKVPTGIP